jgi:hypothetical protein
MKCNSFPDFRNTSDQLPGIDLRQFKLHVRNEERNGNGTVPDKQNSEISSTFQKVTQYMSLCPRGGFEDKLIAIPPGIK